MNAVNVIRCMTILEKCPEKLASEDRKFLIALDKKLESEENMTISSEDSDRINRIASEIKVVL